MRRTTGVSGAPWDSRLLRAEHDIEMRRAGLIDAHSPALSLRGRSIEEALHGLPPELWELAARAELREDY
ncbi:MAG: hypothetical protein UY92_C0009G0004 [Candidatus Magasanikbacteria bacterium GW2011_GWA2_56_11]|uniref:Uncharacterized protein n=1 Tax=Candidatus Magasanikbacteria bacterium GW2011_GWA2_56_11 TaxID=1619044 RepID=A0A0G2ALM6_9BACT|nr:MAG: hypothetical protein UY92_C0009G0004 [Candidatus Magasanikbacteria bacterium GW2011_GWA2_56_11]